MENKIKTGSRITVADCESNRSNNFWAPLIGLKGRITRVCPDDLLDVTFTRSDGYKVTLTGISPTRFEITPAFSWFDKFKNYFTAKFP